MRDILCKPFMDFKFTYTSEQNKRRMQVGKLF